MLNRGMDHLANATGEQRNSTEPILYLRTNFGLMFFMFLALFVSTIAGTLGNLLVVLTISLVRALRTCGNMFILNLALADLVITALINPFNAAGAMSGEHFLMGHPNTLCSIIGSVCAPVCMSSMWNLCLISLNRYVRICHPHQYHRVFSPKSTAVLCSSVWIICYVTLIPVHTGWSRIAFDPDFYICTADMMYVRNAYSYAFFYISLAVFVPLTGLVFGYVQIFRKVRGAKLTIRRHRHSQMQALLDVTSGCGSPKVAPKNPSSVTREDIALVKTLFATAVVFSVCWLPFAMLVMCGHPASTPKWVYVIAMVMAHGNSAMNPVLYGMSNERFREGYRHITGCCPKSRISGRTSVLRPLPADEDDASLQLHSTMTGWSLAGRKSSRVYVPIPLVPDTEK